MYNRLDFFKSRITHDANDRPDILCANIDHMITTRDRFSEHTSCLIQNCVKMSQINILKIDI